MHNLTFEQIDKILDTRDILISLKKDTTGAREAITFIDIVLEDIYPGWKDQIEEEYDE